MRERLPEDPLVVEASRRRLRVVVSGRAIAKTAAAALGASIGLGSPTTAVRDAISSVSLRAPTPREVLGRLIEEALVTAILDCTQHVTRPPPEAIEYVDPPELDDLSLEIGPEFRSDPGASGIAAEATNQIEAVLHWMGADAQAKDVAIRAFPVSFAKALAFLWRKEPARHAVLESLFESPFDEAVARDRAWSEHANWARAELERVPPGYDFAVADCYVSLRAWVRIDMKRKPRTKVSGRLVVDAEHELRTWLRQGPEQIRVISGGPGSGKSTLCRRLAAEAMVEGFHVALIELHLLEPDRPLSQAIRELVKRWSGSGKPPDPFEAAQSAKVLLILDGLDELAMRGSAGRNAAAKVVEAASSIARSPNGPSNLAILLAGREVVVQTCIAHLKHERAVLNLLPYVVPFEERAGLEDPEGLAKQDQRIEWWTRYNKIAGTPKRGVPKALLKAGLEDLSRQPILNHLIALVRSDEPTQIEGGLVGLYERLLESVHRKTWTRNPHSPEFDFEAFEAVLQRFAVVAWRRGGRAAKVSDAVRLCHEDGLDRAYRDFDHLARDGALRLLAAFYFRFQEWTGKDADFFEFVHATFPEFLVARSFAAALSDGWAPAERDIPWWSRPGAWADAEPSERFARWEKLAADHLIRPDQVTLFHGAIRHKWGDINPNAFREISAWLDRGPNEVEETGTHATPVIELSQRTGAALHNLFVCVCGLAGDEGGTIPGTLLSMVAWQENAPISRLGAARCLPGHPWRNSRLDGLVLSDIDLSEARFHDSSFVRAILRRAQLNGTHFNGSQFGGADLSEVNARNAQFRNCEMSGADWRKAQLVASDWRGCTGDRVGFNGSLLNESRWTGCTFRSSVFDHSHMIHSRFVETHFVDCSFAGADLRSCSGLDLSYNFVDEHTRGVPSSLRRIKVQDPTDLGVRFYLMPKA